MSSAGPPGPADLLQRAEGAEAASLAAEIRVVPGATAARLGLACFEESAGRSAEPGTVPVVGSFIATVDSLSLNRVVGLGVSTPATEAQLDRVLDFARAAGIRRLLLQVVPEAQPADLPRWIEARGGRPYNRWIRLFRHTDAPSDAPPGAPAMPDAPRAPATDLAIRTIQPGDAAAFAAVVSDAFGMPREVAEWLEATVGKPGWQHVGAWDGATLVAGAALFVAPGSGTGWLGMAGTSAQARGRGAQGALIRERIRRAAALGCDLVVTETAEESPADPGPSFRNMRRMGFVEAYRRQNYALPVTPPAASPSRTSM